MQKKKHFLPPLQKHLGAPSKISESLQDADMTFESVTDSNGEVHELNQSNYILFTDE